MTTVLLQRLPDRSPAGFSLLIASFSVDVDAKAGPARIGAVAP